MPRPIQCIPSTKSKVLVLVIFSRNIRLKVLETPRRTLVTLVKDWSADVKKRVAVLCSSSRKVLAKNILEVLLTVTGAPNK